MKRINEVKTPLNAVAIEDVLNNRSLKVQRQVDRAKRLYALKYGPDYKVIDSYSVENGVVVLSLWQRPSNRHSKVKGFADNVCS